MNTKPHYQKIFTDMIQMKYPDKKEVCMPLLAKNELTEFDVISISNLLSEGESVSRNKFNQTHKSYSTEAIQKIVNYQKEFGLNDSETARHFKISRNSLKKWKDLGIGADASTKKTSSAKFPTSWK